MHEIALDAGQVAVVQPLEPESVQHRARIVGDAVVRVRGFPNVDVRGLHVDERVDAFRVNGVDTRHDGEGPFDCWVAIVAKRAIGVEIDVKRHLYAIGDLICRRRRLKAHGHDVAPRADFVGTAFELHRLSRVGEQEEHVFAVGSFADGAEVVLAPLVLNGAHHKILHHNDRALHLWRNHAVGQQLGAVHFFDEFAFCLCAADHKSVAEGEEGFQFHRQRFAAQEGKHQRPLVVFVLANVLKRRVDQFEAQVIRRVDRRNFVYFKFLYLKQRDGLLCLRALGGRRGEAEAYECKKHGTEQQQRRELRGKSHGTGVLPKVNAIQFASLHRRSRTRVPLVP